MRKVTKTLAATVFGLLLLELGLRLTGFLYLQINSRATAVTAPHAILCLGDSHTFGIWLKSDDAYPARLQKIIKNQMANDSFAVVNRGVPGMASGDVLARLRENLPERKWDAVIVTVGVNDRWKGAGEQSKQSWFDRLQTVKLIKIAFRGGDAPKPKAHDNDSVVHPDEIAGTPTPGKKDSATISIVDRSGAPVQFEQSTLQQFENDAEFQQKVVHNLKEIAKEARAANTKIIFVSYTSDATDLGIANRALAAAAKESEVPFVSLAPFVASASALHPSDDLYFNDLHPKASLCELIARAVLNQIVEEKIIACEKITNIAERLPVVAETNDAPFEISGALASKDLCILVKTDPRRAVHLFLSFTKEPPVVVLGSKLPIGKDSLFDKTVDPGNPEATRGAAGADGIAKIPISKLLDGAKPGDILYVCAALLGVDGGAGLHRVTGAKEFKLK